jgi:hypothetical protein
MIFSCNSNLNDKSQAYYENKHEMVMVAKIFETYVSSRNLGFSPRKVHCSLGEVALFPKECLLPLVKVFLGGTSCVP